jgi:cell division protein FtsI (penicillin-binding protein 3)/stage V sporulation protein D (sporulation-specific penicillin-binding protein)
MKWNGRTRCALVCVLFIAIFSVFSFRLVYLQMVEHDYYAAIAAGKDGATQTIFAERGAIYDAHNEILAQNVPVENVIADCSLMNDREALAPILAKTLKIPSAEIADKIAGDSRYIILKKALPEAVAVSLGKKLSAAKLRGIRFERDFVRRYPNGSMLCHVVGFSNAEHQGVEGVEASMDQYLRGENGFRHIERDRTGRELVLYRGAERPPRNGYDVHLTIDLNLQMIVENELDAAMREYTPQKATIILMRPQTGEILAMANRPNFDPNKITGTNPEHLKNRAITDMMEPGSTFKIVTVSAALNEHKVRLDTPIFCENGPWLFGGRYLHDHKYFGEIPVQDVLVKSSNIGAAKIALMLGDEKFYEYIRSYGFGDRTGVELPGEIGGLIHPPQAWSKISITRMPMGHEVGVTPLQMIMAMATIANGGELVAPRIVKSVVDNDSGKVICDLKPTVVRRVVSREAAAQVALALRGVVSQRGTAVGAAVPGFTVSGKTGTAQKPDPHGGYEKGKEIVSFSGFLPSENPAFVGLVVLDDAHVKSEEENYGGKIAGPIFAHVAEKAARYLDLEPHEEIGKQIASGRVALTNAHR